MSEQIKQRVDRVKKDTGGKWVSVENVELFGETIVKEVIDLLLDYPVTFNDHVNDNLKHPIQAVKDRFGVK